MSDGAVECDITVRQAEKPLPPPLPGDLASLEIYSSRGWFTDTEYGWRFTPGSKDQRKIIALLREEGWTVLRNGDRFSYRVTWERDAPLNGVRSAA